MAPVPKLGQAPVSVNKKTEIPKVTSRGEFDRLKDPALKSFNLNIRRQNAGGTLSLSGAFSTSSQGERLVFYLARAEDGKARNLEKLAEIAPIIIKHL